MLNEDEIQQMCLRFHDLGFVAYYREPKLCGYVILKPQAIIDAISAVITVKSMLPVDKVTCFSLFFYARRHHI